MSKTKVEHTLTSWSVSQPIMSMNQIMCQPHQSKEGISKTKAEQMQILTSYWSIKQPIMSMDFFKCQPTQVQGGHVQDQGSKADPYFALVSKSVNQRLDQLMCQLT